MASTINSSTSNGIVITPDTSGEIELQANGVTKAKITANGLQDANGNSLRGGSFRNLIINGDMKIAQRGTSASGITSFGYYTIDRFFANFSLGTWTMSQDTDVPTGQGFSNSLKANCTTSASLSASSQVGIETRLEGQNLQQLSYGTSSAETVTLSFWVKSNKTGTYTTELYTPDDVRSISNTFTISSANTWEKKTITIVGDTVGVIDNDNGLGMLLKIWLSAGSDWTSGTLNTSWSTRTNANVVSSSNVNLADSTSNYINITGVQLEVGSGSSNFEFLPYDVQLARCQRYYQRFYDPVLRGVFNGITTGGASRMGFNFPVVMRASPSAATSGTFNFWNGATSTTGSTTSGIFNSPSSIEFDFNIAAAKTQGQACVAYTSNSTAKLIEMDSEL